MVTLTASFAQEKNAPQEKRVSLRVEKNIPFSGTDGQQVCADLYRPDNSEVLPIVVMIHGGAWVAGDKWNVADHAREMARAGFVVMAINYRLAPVHLYPAHLDDCKDALRWVAKHHADWYGDIDRLGVWGYSAGAHLAALLAFGPIDNLPRPIACVAGGIPSDLRKIPENSRLLSPVFGGTRGEKPKVYEEASPIRFVENSSPPASCFTVLTIKSFRSSTVRLYLNASNKRKSHAIFSKQKIKDTW